MNNFNNPKVAAVGGKLIETNNGSIIDLWRQAHLRHDWGKKKQINPIFLSGSNIILRKNAVAQIGGYDEKRYSNNYEDVDLSLRLKKNDFDLIYEPAALARHMRRDTIVSVLKTYWRWKYHDYKQKYILRPIFNLVNSTKLIFEDVVNKNFNLIFIDILAFMACLYFDLRNFLRRLL